MYLGSCFPIKNHLFIILEKDKIFNEIIVYSTNLPDRNPPKLYGIILCDSSGTETVVSTPCAAKVMFRFLGRTDEEIRQRYNIGKREKNVEEYLKRIVPKYIFPEEETDPEIKQILSDISNTIEVGSIPSALRMQK